MNKAEYIENFAMNFIAVWTALNHDKFCTEGRHDELENPPFEDAVFLANKTWEKYYGKGSN